MQNSVMNFRKMIELRSYSYTMKNYNESCPFNESYSNHSLTFFSTLCTDISLLERQWFYDCCYPKQLDENNLGYGAGIWCIIVATLGLTGNLLTLGAIPWAKRNKLFGLEKCWNNATIFVLNLALADFLYCLLDLTFYSIQYLSEYWPFGLPSCKVNAALRYIGAFGAWMSLGMVAFTRCLSLTHPKAFKRLCRGKRCYLMVAGIWSYALIMIIPTATESFGMFGYNKNIGKCDFIKIDAQGSVNPHQVFYGIAFFLPLTLVIVSYSVIWKTSRNSTIYLKRYGCEENKRQLQRRDQRMTWTILVLSLCFFFTVGPITLMNIIDSDMKQPEVHLSFFIIYWFQYCLNFFIYAARSEQYRKAYFCFIKCFLLRSSCSEHKVRLIPHNTIFYINTSTNDNFDFKEFLERMKNDHGALKTNAPPEPKAKAVSFKNDAYNVSIDYDVDLELEKTKVTYNGNVQVNNSSSGNKAIIILPGQLNKTKISKQLSGPGGTVTRSAKISRKKYQKNWNKQMSCPQYYSYTEEQAGSHDFVRASDQFRHQGQSSHDHCNQSHPGCDHCNQSHLGCDHCDLKHVTIGFRGQNKYFCPDTEESCSCDFIKATDEYCCLEGDHHHEDKDNFKGTNENCSLEREHQHKAKAKTKNNKSKTQENNVDYKMTEYRSQSM